MCWLVAFAFIACIVAEPATAQGLDKEAELTADPRFAPPAEDPAGIPAEPEIIVNAPRDTNALAAQINRDIRAVLVRESERQYARFEGPICPSAIGFSEKIEPVMEARIRAVATAANITVGEDGCDSNLHVLVVEDGPAAIKTLRTRHSRAFGQMQPYWRDRLMKGAGPVYNWHLVDTVSTDSGGNRSTLGSGFGGGDNQLLAEPGFNSAMTNVKSRILLPVKQRISHSFVLIERASVIGLTPIQIADFAAMRGLLRTSGSQEDYAGIETVLTLFDNGIDHVDAADTLTPWDLAMLTSLYAAPADMNADRQRSIMARTFQRVLTSME